MDMGIDPPAAADTNPSHNPTSAPQDPSLPLLRSSPGTVAMNPGIQSQPTTETMNSEAIKTELTRIVRSTHMRTRSQAASYNRRTVQAAVEPEDAVMEGAAATARTAHAGSTLLGSSTGATASGLGSMFGAGASAAAGQGAGAIASTADQGAGATASSGAEAAAVSAEFQGVRQADQQGSLSVPGTVVGRPRVELRGLSEREVGKQVADPCVWARSFSTRLCRPVREIDHLR